MIDPLETVYDKNKIGRTIENCGDLKIESVYVDGYNGEPQEFIRIIKTNEIVGFFSFTKKTLPDVIKISRMWVDCEHRSKGYGSTGLRMLENYLKESGYNAICIDDTTEKVNVEAVRNKRKEIIGYVHSKPTFWEKRGYESTCGYLDKHKDLASGYDFRDEFLMLTSINDINKDTFKELADLDGTDPEDLWIPAEIHKVSAYNSS